MMFLKVLAIVILVVLFAYYPIEHIFHISTRSEKLSYKITKDTAAELQKDLQGLQFIGWNGRAYKTVEAIGASFHFSPEVDLTKARSIAIIIIEKYLHAINSNSEIRQFLHIFPFVGNNLEFHIIIRDSNGCDVPLGNICSISVHDGNIYYYIRNIEDPLEDGIYRVKILHEETIEEAMQLARKTREPNDSE